MNFVTAHDGFTPRDVVSYDHKHNEANGENNADGSDPQPVLEPRLRGPHRRPGDPRPRLRQMRNLPSTLLLSQGTPMLVAGDEFSRTQQGNNNVYCQDNELGWIDWRLDDEGRSLLAFTQRLLALRQRYPILRRGASWSASTTRRWVSRTSPLAPGGEEMTEEHWHDEHARCLGVSSMAARNPPGSCAAVRMPPRC